jgi:hypothetical protein
MYGIIDLGTLLQIVALLNHVYAEFDRVAEQYNVYKVILFHV